MVESLAACAGAAPNRRWGNWKDGLLAAVLVFGAPGAVLPSAMEHPEVRTIVARSVQASDADWAAAPRYDFTEDDRTPKGTITSQVMMILGTPYYRRVLVNGKTLPEDQRLAEQRRLEKTIAERRAESPRETAGRIAKYQKDRTRDHLLMSQLTAAFDFKFVREQPLGPYRVWVLKATPRAGYRPPNLETQVLTGMTGTLWIDTKTFQWVKVEAHVVRPVAIEGFLAQVEPGTYFELEKAPVAEGTWLPRHFAMRSRAKVLFLFNHRNAGGETFARHHPLDPSPGEHRGTTRRGTVPISPRNSQTGAFAR